MRSAYANAALAASLLISGYGRADGLLSRYPASITVGCSGEFLLAGHAPIAFGSRLPGPFSDRAGIGSHLPRLSVLCAVAYSSCSTPWCVQQW